MIELASPLHPQVLESDNMGPRDINTMVEIRKWDLSQYNYCKTTAYFSEIYDLKVSSHLLIERDGSLVQFVPFNKKAWHAGVSSFKGRENCNEFSIGIELEGTDENTYTEDQYRALIDVTKELMFVFRDIKKENIVGHSDIAPGRKTDPGKAFDWHYYLSNLV